MSNQKADFISVILNLKISLYLETDNNKTKQASPLPPSPNPKAAVVEATGELLFKLLFKSFK